MGKEDDLKQTIEALEHKVSELTRKNNQQVKMILGLAGSLNRKVNENFKLVDIIAKYEGERNMLYQSGITDQSKESMDANIPKLTDKEMDDLIKKLVD